MSEQIERKVLQIITLGSFTLKIYKETKKCYVGECSVCGMVTPSKTYGTPLDQWFIFHLNGFKDTHGLEAVKAIPKMETMWRIN